MSNDPSLRRLQLYLWALVSGFYQRAQKVGRPIWVISSANMPGSRIRKDENKHRSGPAAW
eukprot:3198118-Prymnesium_polylepis.2